MIQVKIDAKKFREMTGKNPVHDDLDRCNCPKAGSLGHLSCGICEHNLPVFECPRCTKRRIEDFKQESDRKRYEAMQD